MPYKGAGEKYYVAESTKLLNMFQSMCEDDAID